MCKVLWWATEIKISFLGGGKPKFVWRNDQVFVHIILCYIVMFDRSKEKALKTRQQTLWIEGRKVNIHMSFDGPFQRDGNLIYIMLINYININSSQTTEDFWQVFWFGVTKGIFSLFFWWKKMYSSLHRKIKQGIFDHQKLCSAHQGMKLRICFVFGRGEKRAGARTRIFK